MSRLLLTGVVLIWSISSSAQLKTYFSADNIIIDDSDSLKSYYYMISSRGKIKNANDISRKPTLAFYTKTGTVYFNEVTKSNATESTRTYYYPSGETKFVANLLYGQPNGTVLTYYKNGMLKSEVVFDVPVPKNDKEQVMAIILYNDSTGKSLVEKGNGLCHCDLNPFIPNGFYEDGLVKDGFKIDQWSGKSSLTSSTYTELYKEGVLVKGTFLSEGIEYNYTKINDPPSFPGGSEGLFKFLSKKMRYPEGARRGGIEGSVYVTFVINTDGKVIEPRIVEGLGKIGEDLDREALRVVSLFPDWPPGRIRGKPVKVRFTLPLKFKLG